MDPLAGRWDWVREGSHSGQCGQTQADGHLASRQAGAELQDWGGQLGTPATQAPAVFSQLFDL